MFCHRLKLTSLYRRPWYYKLKLPDKLLINVHQTWPADTNYECDIVYSEVHIKLKMVSLWAWYRKMTNQYQL